MGRASASRTGRGLPADHRRRAPALPTTSMMVVVDGKQLFGYGALDRPSIVYSVRKSILAMLYGRYVDSGVIDLDRTLGELGIDDTGGLLPVERRRGCGTCWHRARACTTRPPIPATMPTMPPRARRNRQLLPLQQLGLQCGGHRFRDGDGPGYLRGVRARHRGSLAHGRLPTVEPAQASQRVAFGAPGLPLSAVHARHEPPGPAHASARALGRAAAHSARLGRRDAAARHAGRADAPAAHRGAGLDYGLLWWVLDEPPSSPLAGAYMAWGYYGQFILVVPGRRMVIAHKRDVKPGGGDVARVRPAEFLALARMFADADCP